MLKRTTFLSLFLVTLLLAACEKEEPVAPAPPQPPESVPAPAEVPPAVETETQPAAETAEPAAETAEPAAETAEPAAETPEPAADVAQNGDTGKRVYDGLCVACHAAGVAGAPKFGDKDAWAPRIAKGMDTLYTHSINGFQGETGVMPPKGGNPSLSDAEVKAAVDYMVEQVQ